MDDRMKNMMKDAAKLASLGRSKLLAKGRPWSDEEIDAQSARIRAAFRMRDESMLEAALDVFGGLPPESSYGSRRGNSIKDPLFISAEHPDAFGFERLLSEREKELPWIELPLDQQNEGLWLGAWLRKGIYGTGPDHVDAEPDDLRDRSVLGHGLIAPVAAALCHDNPLAMASILSNEKRFKALLAMEPQGLLEELDDGDAKAWYEDVIKSEHGKPLAERSLVWNAVACRAYRCAALLASMPEFAAPLCEARRHVAGADGFRENTHRANNTMRGVPFSEPNFFCWALRKGVAQGGSVWLSGDDSLAWRAMVESMVDGASDSAKSWRGMGCGGWSDVLMVQLGVGSMDAKGETGRERLEWCRSVLGRMSDLGFAMDWPALSKRCDKSSPMRDWLALQGAAKGASKPGKSMRM